MGNNGSNVSAENITLNIIGGSGICTTLNDLHITLNNVTGCSCNSGYVYQQNHICALCPANSTYTSGTCSCLIHTTYSNTNNSCTCDTNYVLQSDSSCVACPVNSTYSVSTCQCVVNAVYTNTNNSCTCSTNFVL